MTHRPINLVMLPGVGADERLFGPQLEAFPAMTIPPWIEPCGGESLPDYAGRLARSIDAQRPLVVGGVSFGGMVAYEMARHLPVDGVVLIASCRTRAGIRSSLRGLRWLHRLLPASSVRLVRPFAPWGVRVLWQVPAAYRRLCIDMFNDCDPRFLKWALQAILNWTPSAAPDVPVHQIHGQRDRVIPAATVAADQFIADGGHLINLTHAAVVNRFVQGVVG
jgi:pimeloyl-ACP methyl ester carboxylesterase